MLDGFACPYCGAEEAIDAGISEYMSDLLNTSPLVMPAYCDNCEREVHVHVRIDVLSVSRTEDR